MRPARSARGAVSSKATSSDALPPPVARPFIGVSGSITAVREAAESIAERRTTVMILGETGAGKEMLSRHIHAESDRAQGPFVPVDCSALTDTLFESELFGHIAGAFTGAVRDKLGFIRAADGGTLFLDEIGELSLPLQAKLLRVIQERQVVPVGAAAPIDVNVRIICATHRKLAEMVDRGEFRQDLFYRLNVVVLTMPPLRERPADVVTLADHFLRAHSALYNEPPKSLTAATTDVLQRYAWPGNVRELANVIEHAYVMAGADAIEVSDLPERVQWAIIDDDGASLPDRERAASGVLCLADIERRTIAEALRRTKGNKSAACRMLGINIQRLNRRIDKLRVDC